MRTSAYRRRCTKPLAVLHRQVLAAFIFRNAPRSRLPRTTACSRPAARCLNLSATSRAAHLQRTKHWRARVAALSDSKRPHADTARATLWMRMAASRFVPNARRAKHMRTKAEMRVANVPIASSRCAKRSEEKWLA